MKDFNDYSGAAFIIVIMFCFLCFYNMQFETSILQDTEMQPFAEPKQEMLTQPQEAFIIKKENKSIEVTPIAKYKLYGRVLAIQCKKNKDSFNEFVPFDIALGWNDFAIRKPFKYIKIVQVGRTSYWIAHSGCRYNCQQIQAMYSNNHIIPANKNIYNGLKNLNKKNILYIEGYLVNIKSNINGNMKGIDTSLSRTDTKSEIIYATKIITKKGVFQ